MFSVYGFVKKGHLGLSSENEKKCGIIKLRNLSLPLPRVECCAVQIFLFQIEGSDLFLAVSLCSPCMMLSNAFQPNSTNHLLATHEPYIRLTWQSFS